MVSEKIPTHRKHSHEGNDPETKKEEWTAPRVREIRARATASFDTSGADGSENTDFSADS